MAPVVNRAVSVTWDEQIATRTLWAECRGEPEDGQRAVAHVLWNRLEAGIWGSSLASVCLWPYQFSCWNTDDKQRRRMAAMTDDDPALIAMRHVLMQAKMRKDDPSKGACFYHADYVSPDWAPKMRFTARIGRHLFYSDK